MASLLNKLKKTAGGAVTGGAGTAASTPLVQGAAGGFGVPQGSTANQSPSLPTNNSFGVQQAPAPTGNFSPAATGGFGVQQPAASGPQSYAPGPQSLVQQEANTRQTQGISQGLTGSDLQSFTEGSYSPPTTPTVTPPYSPPSTSPPTPPAGDLNIASDSPTPDSPTSGAFDYSQYYNPSDAYTSAKDQYLASLKGNQDTLNAQQELADYQESARLGISQLEGQGRNIPLNLIRGEQSKLNEQAGIGEQTRLQKLQNLQTADAQNQSNALAQFELAQTEEQARDDKFAPITVGNQILQLNPETGQYDTIYSPPASGEGEQFTLNPGQVRYDASGNPIAVAPAAPETGAPTVKEIGDATYQWNQATQNWDYLSASSSAGGSAGGTQSADQLKAQGFYNRASSAEANITAIMGDVGNLAQGVLPSMFQGADYQLYEQGAQDWIKAILRRESGAAIPDTEMDAYFQTFFPQFGDKQGTITQKAASRQTALDALQIQSGTPPPGGGGDIGDIDAFLDSFNNDLSTSGNGSSDISNTVSGFRANVVGSVKPSSQLKSLSIGNRTIQANASVADRLSRADADYYAATGKHLSINQDFRSPEKQQQLYRDLSARGAQVAPQGYSFHEVGMAFDVGDTWQEVRPYMQRYGFRNDLPNDRGHYSIGEFS